MANEKIVEFIKNSRSLNIPDYEITGTLLKNGSTQEDINTAFQNLGNTSPSSVQPANTLIHVGMWTGFLYILFFISLYILATSMGGLFHMWVDKLVPTPDSTTDYSYDGFNDWLIRGYIAALIVSYPIFAILAVNLRKQLLRQPSVKNLRSRKLLIYLTLIATFLISMGQIIGTLFQFLGGAVTLNTLGHLFVTLLIAGSIFGYFINEVKHDRKNIQ